MPNQFNVGDFCFCDYKLVQVTRKDGDNIIEISDGWFIHNGSSLNDRCFPLELATIRISDDVKMLNKKLLELRNNGINHPDLHRKMVSMWVKLCNNRNNPEQLKSMYDELETFASSVIDKVNELSNVYVQDVKLFRK